MKIIAALPLLLLSSLSIASPIDAQALEACTKIANDVNRLACFDQALTSQPLTKTDASIDVNKDANIEIETAPIVAVTAKQIKTQPLTAAPSEKSEPAATSNESDFGLSAKVLLEKSTQTQSISAQVNAIKESVNGYNTFTLSNEQRWKQSESRSYRIKVGDTVIISRGAMGSFLMKKQGANRTIRVKRLE